jgi:hypothetical protein
MLKGDGSGGVAAAAAWRQRLASRVIPPGRALGLVSLMRYKKADEISI